MTTVPELVNIQFLYDGTLDKTQGIEGIVLGVFEDERPLKGVSGFVDWRMHGMLSRLMIELELIGKLGENWLIPSQKRLPIEKIFIFGLGKVVDLTATRYQEIMSDIVKTLSKAKVENFAISLWDLTRGRVAPEEAAGIVVRELIADKEKRTNTFFQSRSILCIERGPWGRVLRDGFKHLQTNKSNERIINIDVR